MVLKCRWELGSLDVIVDVVPVSIFPLSCWGEFHTNDVPCRASGLVV